MIGFLPLVFDRIELHEQVHLMESHFRTGLKRDSESHNLPSQITHQNASNAPESEGTQIRTVPALIQNEFSRQLVPSKRRATNLSARFFSQCTQPGAHEVVD
jgi:hypothetical protein